MREEEKIARCSTCGQIPAAGVEFGTNIARGYIACPSCGKRTSSDQSFAEARNQWNRDLAGRPKTLQAVERGM